MSARISRQTGMTVAVWARSRKFSRLGNSFSFIGFPHYPKKDLTAFTTLNRPSRRIRLFKKFECACQGLSVLMNRN